MVFPELQRLAIIPARGGSKRIERKNIRDFLGTPIIAYSIRAALQAGIFDEVMVSTDDEEIAAIGMQFGASVPFMRSPEMSGDCVPTLPVLREVLSCYQKSGREFSSACCIYPAAPFVTAEILRKGMEILAAGDCDAVVPVVSYTHPLARALRITDGKLEMLQPENANLRSQDLPVNYHDAGQFYCFRVEALARIKTFLDGNVCPFVLSEMNCQDIDHETDWKMAELKYRILHHGI